MANLNPTRWLPAAIVAVFLLAACQSANGHHSASAPALTAPQRADLKWPVIPGFAGTACNLVPPAAIVNALGPVQPATPAQGSGAGAAVVDKISLRRGTDGGGDATCAEAWNGRARQFVIDYIRRGDQFTSYEASELQPRRYAAGLPSEIYATFASGSGHAVTATAPYKAGDLELTGSPGLGIAQLTTFLRIALARAPKFAPPPTP